MLVETPRILVADNDALLRLMVCRALEREGYRVDVMGEGRPVLAATRDTPYDLLLLDVSLPDLNGLEVCRRVRERSKIPIMLLSERVSEADAVAGLDAGADDYVRKPLEMAEFIARIKATLRRVRLDGLPPAAEASVRTGQLTVDVIRQSATLDGRFVPLGVIEGRLLAYLARHINRLVPSKEIIEQVWEPIFTKDTSMIWIAIWRLRRKIEADPSRPIYIRTDQQKGGYFLAQLPESD